MRQIRVAVAAGDHGPTDSDEPLPADTLQELELRIAHLEQQLRGLQDSVHRENVRYTSQLAELTARVEPSALAVALERDARERGL